VKRAALCLFSVLALVLSLLLSGVSTASAQPSPRQSIALMTSPGADIFRPESSTPYEMGLSLSVDQAAGRVDQWNCSIGRTGAQVINYRAQTVPPPSPLWSPPTTVLEPTPGSFDGLGVCDPSVVKVGDYYYMAYTGTATDPILADHYVFLARSTSPNSGFVKWTGTGWGGGTPAPIIPTVRLDGYGTGQPSLVVRNGVMYVFYEYHSRSVWQTRLSVAPLGTDPTTWPTRLEARGVAIEHPGFDTTVTCPTGGMTESTDVKYVPQSSSFTAVTTNAAGFKFSALQTWESTDGLHFTQAITQNGDYQRYPRDPAVVSDQQGNVMNNSYRGVAFNYGTGTCGPWNTRWSELDYPSVPTGWVDQPLTTTAADWRPRVGQWEMDSGAYHQNDTFTWYGYSTLDQGRIGANATIDFDVKAQFDVDPLAGVQFGQLKPNDTYEDSGYLLTYGDYTVQLWKGDDLIGVAKSPNGPNSYKYFTHVRVVTSDGSIYVYARTGNSYGDMLAPLISASDADDPFLGGYVSLATRGNTSAAFQHFTISDNLAPASVPSDWGQSTGTWNFGGPTTLYAQASENKIYRQNAGAMGQYGDGAYTATIRLGAGSDPNAWGGINLTNAKMVPDWGPGGYLIFLRRNGKLGVFKGGVGQIVPDQPTDVNPVAAAVKMRIFKTGEYIQVYLNDETTPALNYQDLSGSPVIGGWGLATLGTTGTFSDVSYAGNYGS
jgi:hypothetical protein